MREIEDKNRELQNLFDKPVEIFPRNDEPTFREEDYVEERDFRSEPGFNIPKDDRTDAEIAKEEALREKIAKHK